MASQVSIWKQCAIAAVAIAVGVGVWTQFGPVSFANSSAIEQPDRKKKKRNRRAPVIVAAVETAADNLTVEMVGTGRAKRSVVLRSETDGKIAKLALAPGKQFVEGDVLVQLASREAVLAVSLAKARLAEAVRSRDRFTKLQRRGNVAAARLDEARTAAEVARLELAQARQRHTTRSIRAPFDGVAGLTEVEVGTLVDTGVAIARYDDRSAIVVEFDLPEALLKRVSLGMPLAVTTPSAASRSFTGMVAAVDNRFDAVSRSIRVRAEVPNPDDQLRPGASFIVRMNFPGKTYARTPELAVQYSRSSLHVWRVADHKVEQVPVRLVRRLDGAVLVDGNLVAGDLVVIEGTQRLRPGVAVQVLGDAR